MKEEQLSMFQYLYPIPKLKKEYRDEEGWYDDWHYTDEEEPPENDIYYTIHTFGDSYIYGYQAWSNGKWYSYDSYFSRWKIEKRYPPFAWVRIPSLFNRVDKYLHEMQGMNGIID